MPPPPATVSTENLSTGESLLTDNWSSSSPRLVKTKPNKFGLYKSYRIYSNDIPHDPDISTPPSDLKGSNSSPVEIPGAAAVEAAIEAIEDESRQHSATPASAIDQGEKAKLEEGKRNSHVKDGKGVGDRKGNEGGKNDNDDKTKEPSLYPFPNISSFRLGEWFWSDDHEKSQRSFQNLLNIVGSDTFNPGDVRKANWSNINRVLASSQYDNDGAAGRAGPGQDDGVSWKTANVTIKVPISKSYEQPGSYSFTVPGFHYRPLVPVIKARLESTTRQESFHTLGSELRWKPGESKEDVRVYGELYHSPVFLQAYEELQELPPEPGCTLSRHIVGLMFASDATMLASFGSAKIWPCYMFFGNDSKYKRARPSDRLFETVAYFEKLPDHFKDFIAPYTGQSALNSTLVTHCQRDLFHEQWRHILDSEFIEAYCHGIVVTCYDGVQRRFYPRIFTYSADYPEKILIASIKNLGTFPCPRCKVAMKDVPAMGKVRDRNNRVRLARRDNEIRRKRVKDARVYLYEDHLSFASNFVEARMDDGSLVPTDNAFSSQLFQHGFDLFRMLVVDVMHEVELGVWKALFIQLLRLLEATRKGTMNELDARYRSMPTFGKDTIRRFINNASEMKQLAARDFEDLLQCAIPAFEGLLPYPHNERVMELLFTFGMWHGYAKLRLHTDHTLTTLDDLTIKLGDQMRKFVDKTCSKIETRELPREYQARKRREARKTQAASVANSRETASTVQVEPTTTRAPAAPITTNGRAAPTPTPKRTVRLKKATTRPKVVPAAHITSRAADICQSSAGAIGGTSSEEARIPSGSNLAPAAVNPVIRQNDPDPSVVPEKKSAGKKRKSQGPPTRSSKRLKDLAQAAVGFSDIPNQDGPTEGSSEEKAPSDRVDDATQAQGMVNRRNRVGSPKVAGPSNRQTVSRGREADQGDSHPTQQQRKSARGRKRRHDAQDPPDSPSGKAPEEEQAQSEKPKQKKRKTAPLVKKRAATGTTPPDSSNPGGKRKRGSGPSANARKRQKVVPDAGEDQEQAPVETAEALEEEETRDTRRVKTLNLSTYKWHSLGDVAPTIRLFGTTDSYSTQIPERFHRYPKMHYKRTSKKNVPRQLSRIQARQSRIRKLRKQLVPEGSEDYREDSDQALPYFIGKSENHPIELPAFIQAKKHDPAVKNFIPKLKNHLLPRVYRRLLQEEQASDDTDEDRLRLLETLVLESNHSADGNDGTAGVTPTALPDLDRLYIHSDRIYQHQILHINFTTYDVRQETDIINPSTSRRDVMCLRIVDHTTAEGDRLSDVHRFVHARVLGVYHVNVLYRGRGASDLRRHRFDFLWVRWYSFCEDIQVAKSFDRLSLRSLSDPDAVGFIDPMDVLRASHIIPRYFLGQLYGPWDGSRIQSKVARDQDDWCEYYANRFVDRDMIMRYAWGHGVGHTYSHADAPSMDLSSSGSVDPHSASEEAEILNPATVEDTMTPSNVVDRPQEESTEAEVRQNSAEAVEDTLENLEEQELALGDHEDDEDGSDLEEKDVQEPETDAEE